MLFPMMNILYLYISAQCPVWLFSVVVWCRGVPVCCSNTFWMLTEAVPLCLLLNKLHLFSRTQHTREDAVRININLCCVRLDRRSLLPECFWDGSSCPYYYWYHFYFTLLLLLTYLLTLRSRVLLEKLTGF